MSWKALSSGFAFWITLTSFGHADTIVPITPSQENTLIESSAGTLSNGQGNIYAGLTNQAAGINIRRGLLEFNIAGNIPAGATITGGTLAMTDVTSGTTGSQTLTLHDVSQAWGQGTSYATGGNGAAAMTNDATWLYPYFNASSPWNNPGGDFSLAVSGSATDTTNGQQVVWSNANNPQMITDIQNWLNTPATDFGWLLQGNESQSQSAKIFGAGSHYGGTRPTLTVSYAVPEPASVWLTISGVLAAAALRAGHTGYRKH